MMTTVEEIIPSIQLLKAVAEAHQARDEQLVHIVQVLQGTNVELFKKCSDV